MHPKLEFEDMQGLLVSAYAHLPCAAYVLLQVTHGASARQWLATLSARVTTAARKQNRASLNVAITHEGLAALGVSMSSLSTFPLAMQDGGMSSERRSRILGDVESGAPTTWRWGGLERPVHVLLLVFAMDETVLSQELASLAATPDCGVVKLTELRAGRQPDSKEHFGFSDGVGQPVVEGSGRAQRQLARTDHVTEVAAGEFVLGYPNADGALPISPTFSAEEDPHGQLSAVPGSASRRDFGRNGSFLVFRQLEQDVAGFWQAAAQGAAAIWPGDAAGPNRLASKMVGRWPSGAPLVRNPESDPFNGTPQPKTDNNFAYAADDPHALACPFGAHIRRSNPRDALGPDAEKARTSANRHRLLRRGRSYGDRAPDPMLADGVERGLHFICLNADIERQFEFVQQTWLNNPSFSGLADEVDAISGARTPNYGQFTIPCVPVRLRAQGLTSHVRVVGGAYWFLPGMRALRVLTRQGASSTVTALASESQEPSGMM